VLTAARASVIVPCWNRADTIAATLASVADQTEDRLDVIVVDDGSEDGSAEVVRRSGPASLRVLRTPHRGVAHARNVGLAAAVAPVVCFLDADDQWCPDTVRSQLAALAGNVSVVFGDCLLSFPGRPDRRLSADVRQPAAPTLTDLLAARPVPLSTVAARRRAVLDAGGFEPTLPSCEDYDLWYRLSCRGHVFRRIPAVLARIVLRPDGLSADLDRYRSSMDRVLARLLDGGRLTAAERELARRLRAELSEVTWPAHEADGRTGSVR
jgi:glycosyltransferase involved in cell wall biosynthesis